VRREKIPHHGIDFDILTWPKKKKNNLSGYLRDLPSFETKICLAQEGLTNFAEYFLLQFVYFFAKKNSMHCKRVILEHSNTSHNLPKTCHIE
jgi:hypothetical protein